ncbi:CDP-alcohol phosphatidyltransferase family protein [Bifidobacterium aquikefiri]|uniref:CDP-alcohol phosphatidyltransferase family protein n=1 Tax=Bifidobacterium aquikefiri TaxID=1653207 RepID=UPI0039EAF630
MRWIPNTLTLLRCICTISLPFLDIESAAFLLAYIAAGMTDILDGFLARRWQAVTPVGATFDSVADMLFTLTFLYVFMTFLQWAVWLTLWIGALCVVKVLTLIVGWVRFRRFAFLHTTLNKLSGIMIFVAPLFILKTGVALIGIIPCTLASLASLEELIITCISGTFHPDIRSLMDLQVNHAKASCYESSRRK